MNARKPASKEAVKRLSTEQRLLDHATLILKQEGSLVDAATLQMWVERIIEDRNRLAITERKAVEALARITSCCDEPCIRRGVCIVCGTKAR